MTMLRVLLLGLLVAAVAGCSDRAEPVEPTTQAAADPQRHAAGQPAASQAEPAGERPTGEGPTDGTVVTPYLEHPIEPGRNLLWCATFQMAWDRLKELAGGPVETTPGSKTVAMLNRKSIDPAALPSSGAMSAAGLIGDGILADIRSRMKQLPGAPEPGLLPAEGDLPADAVIAYAYLARSLRFETAFSLLEPVAFIEGESPVAWFGIKHYALSEISKAQGGQVRVLWHRFEQEDQLISGQQFIVELEDAQKQDRLLLAKVAPAATLSETIDRVMTHVRSPNSKTTTELVAPEITQLIEEGSRSELAVPLGKLLSATSSYACLLTDEYVRVPLIRLDLTRQFDDLIGQTVVSGSEKVRNKPIIDARQRIRFELDEKGADLESEAMGSLFGYMGMRDFSFTRPFLVLLMRQGADRPYFALWVGNSDLLVKAPEPAE